jgi:LPXTG-motif cell wall-anchored protein
MTVAFQMIPASSITGGSLTINFTTPPTVTAGTRYVFLIAFDPTGASFPISNTLTFPAGPAPADKRAVYTGMLAPYVDSTNGINFTTYIDASSSSGPGVPAPGPSDEKLADTGASESVTSIWFGVSAGLLAGGVLALVTVRRRLARR